MRHNAAGPMGRFSVGIEARLERLVRRNLKNRFHVSVRHHNLPAAWHGNTVRLRAHTGKPTLRGGNGASRWARGTGHHPFPIPSRPI